MFRTICSPWSGIAWARLTARTNSVRILRGRRAHVQDRRALRRLSTSLRTPFTEQAMYVWYLCLQTQCLKNPPQLGMQGLDAPNVCVNHDSERQQSHLAFVKPQVIIGYEVCGPCIETTLVPRHNTIRFFRVLQCPEDLDRWFAVL